MPKILFPAFIIIILLVAIQFSASISAQRFILNDSALYAVQETNGEKRLLTNNAATIFDQKNGYVLYSEKIVGQPAESEAIGAGDLWLTNENSSIRKRIVDKYIIRGAILAPKTKKIFYLTNAGELFSTDFEGNNQTVVAKKLVSPALSEDETLLTFQRLNDDWQPNDYFENAKGIAVYNLTNGKETLITSTAEDFAPVFSPKVTKIIFNSLSREGLASLFAVNIDGSERTQLTNIGQKFVTASTVPTPADRPIWSNNGKYFVYESDNEIWLLEFSADLMSIMKSQRIAYGKSPRWADDEKIISVLTNNDGGDLIHVDINGNLIK